MTKIWTPQERTEWEKGVQEIEPTDRARPLPDGRIMRESRLTLSPEWMDQIWKGYRCAVCLELHGESFPEACRFCGFPMKAEQRRQLEQDFVGQQPPSLAGFSMEREQAYLEREHYMKKGSVTPGKEL